MKPLSMAAALAAALCAAPALAAPAAAPAAHDMASMPGMDHSAMPGMDHAGHDTMAAAPAAHNMAGMPGMDHAAMPGMDHAGHDTTAAAPAAHDMAGMPGMDHAAMPYRGVQGFYPMTRDASGTSWQPDASTHAGVHGMSGGWSLMGHAVFNGVYDSQSGRRGDDKAFLSGMVMGSARRDFERGDVLNLRVMLAPDPPMGPRGYPLLLAAGETADGRTTLVVRQQPHDVFLERSASYSRGLSQDDAQFV